MRSQAVYGKTVFYAATVNREFEVGLPEVQLPDFPEDYTLWQDDLANPSRTVLIVHEQVEGWIVDRLKEEFPKAELMYDWQFEEMRNG